MAREKNSAPIWICIALAILTFAAYWHSGSGGFVNLDDDAYVEFQPMVNQGLRSAAVAWAFTGVHSTNWHPLTSLSLILDCTLFGINPGPIHIENVVLHTLNTLLVFLVWRAFSGKTWPPALVAALFALHPLHVESVAWISERKDVLSTFFWLLGMAAYLFYTRKQSLRRYLLLAACFLLALLSKPMAVTFPAALLLLDFWPLHRWPAKSWKALVLEKIPLFGLAIAHAAVTFLVQHAAGAANYGRRFPLASRLGNAAVSCARYLGKTFYPAHLSPLYWHPGYWPAWAVAACLLLLAALTCLAWRWLDTRPWFTFGWLWFLGTLLPVIGIIQVGAQSMADRYTYIPLLGIFTLLAWAGEDIAIRLPKTRLPISATASIFIAACCVLTIRQVRTWHDSISLYQASIAAGEDNPAIRYLYAIALQSTGHSEDEVATQFHRALDLDPTYVNASTQLCIIAMRHGDFTTAFRIANETLAADPANAELYKNLGSLYRIAGKPAESLPWFRKAIAIDPNCWDAHQELGWMALNENRLPDAVAELSTVVRINPWDDSARNDLGAALYRSGDPAGARACFEKALWINPKNASALANLRGMSGVQPGSPAPPHP